MARARRQSFSLADRSTPANTVVWAVGDVHGQDDLFDRLAQVIEHDLRSPAKQRRVLVLLGDYIDRGIGARAVIDRAISLRQRLGDAGAEFYALKGNHEEMLLRFLANPNLGPAWMEIGGRETLLAYEVTPPLHGDGADAWRAAADMLREGLGPDHLSYLEGLRLHHVEGGYLFVHAGIRPGAALEDQKPDDLIWIRDAFLLDQRPFSHLVVHGHTPEPEARLNSRRLGLDTGAYATGVLSAVRLQAGHRVLVQARRGADGVRIDQSQLIET